MKWRGRIPQHGHTRDLRHGFLEELQPLHARFREQDREAGDVPSGPRKAGDEPASHGISAGRHDNRHRRGGLHGGPDGKRHVSSDEIHLEPGQLCRQTGQTVIAPLGISPLDDEVLSFDVAERTQTLPNGLRRIRVGRVQRHQDADAPHPSSLWLRLDGARRKDEAENDREPDQPHGHLV